MIEALVVTLACFLCAFLLIRVIGQLLDKLESLQHYALQNNERRTKALEERRQMARAYQDVTRQLGPSKKAGVETWVETPNEVSVEELIKASSLIIALSIGCGFLFVYPWCYWREVLGLGTTNKTMALSMGILVPVAWHAAFLLSSDWSDWKITDVSRAKCKDSAANVATMLTLVYLAAIII